MLEKKVSRRVMMTKRLIKDSLIELLEEKSIQNITITEICSRADINRSTFYAYYDSPYDLMTAIKIDIIEDTKKLLDDYPSLPPRKRLELLLGRHLEYISAHIKELMAFSSDVGEDFALPAETMEIILTPYLNSVLSEKLTKERQQTITTFCIFGTIGIVKSWIRASNGVSVPELSETIIGLIDDICSKTE